MVIKLYNTTHQGGLSSSDLLLLTVWEKPAYYSIRNGRWADPETWDRGEVPEKDAKVEVRHIVYTGSTSMSFGGRAYGEGANALFSSGGYTVGVDYLEGPNETSLVDNLLSANKYKLAETVTITSDGTLLLGKGGNAGDNIATDTLMFGTIFNNAIPASGYAGYSTFVNATSSAIFATTYGSDFRGFQIMTGGPTTLVSDSTINHGYTYIAGNFDITNGAFSNTTVNTAAISTDAVARIVNGIVHIPSIFDNVVSGPSTSPLNAVFNVDGGRIYVDTLLIGLDETAMLGTESYTQTDGEIFIQSDVATFDHTTSSNTVFNIAGGLFIIDYAAKSVDNLITANIPMQVTNTGLFVINENTEANLVGDAGIALAPNTTTSPLFARSENALEYNMGVLAADTYIDVNSLLSMKYVENITNLGAFAMLQGSKLNVKEGGISNNKSTYDNVFFEIGRYNNSDVFVINPSFKNDPAVISYWNNINIMPTAITHPYATLELYTGSTGLMPTNTYIAANRKEGLVYLRDADLNMPNDTITFLTFLSSPIFGADGQASYDIIGRVERRNALHYNNYAITPINYYSSITGVIADDYKFVYNNKYTQIEFNTFTPSTMTKFALTSSPVTQPAKVIQANDNKFRAQRNLLVDYAKDPTANIDIRYLTLGVRGITEVSDDLFSKKLLFGEGYDNTKQPLKLANVDLRPATNTAGLAQYAMNDDGSTLIHLTNATGSNPPDEATLESGNSLLLYAIGLFTSVRAGRWSDPLVWSAGVVPSAKDSVIIRHIIYTGLWKGAGETDGHFNPANVNNLFGARPYGRAESDINFNATLNEALLSGKIKIVAPDSFTPDGEDPLPAGPSALLICALLNGTTMASPSNFYTQCQTMDFSTTLVFSDFVQELNPTNEGITRMIINTGDDSNFNVNLSTDIFTVAQNPSAWVNLNGLYIISNNTGADVIMPTIRALNIQNEGLIQNEGIIDIGK
jgi:hypothetical protein